VIAPDAKVVRHLRSRVRVVVKASPALRRERKRTRASWRHRQYTWGALRFLIPVVIAIVVLSGDAPERVSGMLVFWSALIVMHRAAQLATLLHAPESLWVFYHLPVTNEAALRHQTHLALRSSLWIGVDWLVFGVALAIRAPSVALWCAAPVFAFAQWATALALAATLVRWRPRLPYPLFATVLYVLFFLVLRTLDVAAVTGYSGALLRALERGTPAGWLASAFAQIPGGNRPPALASGHTGRDFQPRAYLRLRRRRRDRSRRHAMDSSGRFTGRGCTAE
jgi:hypothetical protein